MITFHKGNLFDAKVDAYVNTVNCVGVMGKGIALECKTRYPKSYEQYRIACERKQVQIGLIFVTMEGQGKDEKFLLHFPTKEHWKDPSKYLYIALGLPQLAKELMCLPIRSVAIPALGCTNGGLDWKEVKEFMTYHLKDLANYKDIQIYEP